MVPDHPKYLPMWQLSEVPAAVFGVNVFKSVSATSLSELPSFKHVFNTAISFRAKDVSLDLDVPFVCWRPWSGLVQLWRNSVRASAKPWFSWFCCLFLLLAAFPPAPPLSSVRFMWAVCLCKFPLHFLISEPESGYAHFGHFWLCFPFSQDSQNVYIFEGTTKRISAKTRLWRLDRFSLRFLTNLQENTTVTNFLEVFSHDLIRRFIFRKFGFCFRRINFFWWPQEGGVERLKKHDQHPPKIPINNIHPRFKNGSSPKGHFNIQSCWPSLLSDHSAIEQALRRSAMLLPPLPLKNFIRPWRFPVPPPRGGPWGARLVRHVKHVLLSTTKLTSTTK